MFENENGSNTVQHMCTTQQTKISCNKRYGEKQFISPTSKFQKKLFGGDKVLWKRKPLDPLLWGFPRNLNMMIWKMYLQLQIWQFWVSMLDFWG